MRDNTLQCTFGKDGKQYQGILIIHGKTATLYKSAIMEPMPGAVARGQMRDNTLQCTFGKDGKQYQGILIIHGKTATLYKSAIMEPMPVTTVR